MALYLKLRGLTLSKPRQNGSVGGGKVKIYIQNHVIWNWRTDLENDEVKGIAVKIMPKKAKTFYIFVMYRHTYSSKFLHPKFNAVFHNLISQLSLKECILQEDSNVNFLKRSDNCEFKSILQLFSFKQLIGRPTKINNYTESLIDTIASNNCASIKDTAIVPYGIAGHELIGCIRKLNHMKSPEITVICRDYRFYDPAKHSEYLSEIDWNLIYNCHDANLAWKIFNDILLTVFNKFTLIITKRVRGKCSPWLFAQIKSQRKISERISETNSCEKPENLQ